MKPERAFVPIQLEVFRRQRRRLCGRWVFSALLVVVLVLWFVSESQGGTRSLHLTSANPTRPATSLCLPGAPVNAITEMPADAVGDMPGSPRSSRLRRTPLR